MVVRAGSSVWQRPLAGVDEYRIQGTVPLPLSAEDEEVLREIAVQLQGEKPDCLFSSGNESSGSTAELLGRLCDLKPKVIESLHEFDFGLWQGLRIAEIKKRYGRAYRQWRSDPTSIRPPQGESLREASRRVAEVLETIGKKNKGKTIVIVTAEIVTALIECILTDIPVEQLWNVTEQTEDISIFNLQNQSGSKASLTARKKALSR